MKKLLCLFVFILALSCSKGLKMNYKVQEEPLFKLQPADSLYKKWQQKIKADLVDLKVLNDQYILIADSRGGLTVLYLETGQKEDNYWDEYKTPIQLYGVIDDKLYFSAEEKIKVVCWNLLTSNLVWQKNFKHDFYSMVNHSDTLYFQAKNALSAVNAATGDVIRTRNIKKQLRPGLLFYDNKLFAIDVQGTLRVFNKKLKIVTTHDLDVSMARALIPVGSTLLVYNADGTIKLFSLLQNQIVYSRDFERPLYAKPLLIGNVMVVPFADGVVHAYDMSNNALQWTFRRKGLMNIDPVYFDEKLILFYARGEIIILDLKNRNQQWRYDAEQSIDCAALTPRGILVSHHKKCSLIGAKK